MASPKMEVFFLFNDATDAPKTGQTGLSFDSYKDEAGTDVSPQPAIVEIGGGAYGFTPAFPSSSHGICYVLNCGSGVFPTHVTRYMRSEDWLPDGIQTLLDVGLGGATVDAALKQMILYKPDGITEIARFNLLDDTGAATVGPSIFSKVPA